jgi:glucokinase
VKPLLVADIGGTHARLALVDAQMRCSDVVVRPTATVDSVDALLDDYLVARERLALAGLCVAIAGPVVDGAGHLTNGGLSVDVRRLRGRHPHALVINDFIAAAMGVPMVGESGLHSLGGEAPMTATKAVIGPGTGLGMGMLIVDGDRYRALPSEGGHGDLASTSPLEHEIYQVLSANVPFVSWESALSGPGLVNLYRAVCAVWGCHAEHTRAEDITRLAADADDPVCHQTVDLFCNLLGTAAGTLAITVCAVGGVYLCGGMVPPLLSALAGSQFRRRFEARGPMTGFVRPIATVAVTTRDLGLLGAAAAWQARFPAQVQ